MSEPDELALVFRELCALEAPLGVRLAAFSSAVRRYAPPFAEAYEDLVERLRSSAAGTAAPGPGDEMPPFALPDGKRLLHTLDELLLGGPLVISFNRGHWCEYCALELTALRRGLKEIAASGANVVSIMPESAEYVAKAQAEIGDAFLVLSDENNGYALSLNLVIWLGERVRELCRQAGVRLDYYQGNNAWFVPIPATFVVGVDARIAARFVDPDFRRRMEIEDILAALNSLQN